LLAPSPWYEGLSPEAARRRALWCAFLEGEDPKEAVVRRGDWVVGGAGFRHNVHRPAARPEPRGCGRPWQAERGTFVPESPVSEKLA
jgi:hypothetical protein